MRKLQRALITSVLDGVGEGSAKACWVLMLGASADMFGCASHGKIFQLHQKLPPWRPKKPDRYWCAPSAPPGVRKAQSCQAKKWAMSGALKLTGPAICPLGSICRGSEK